MTSRAWRRLGSLAAPVLVLGFLWTEIPWDHVFRLVESFHRIVA